MVVFEYILLRKSAGPCLETSFMIIAIIEELYLEISFVIPAVLPGLYLEILFMVSAKHFFYWRYNPLWVCILQPSSGL